MLERSRLKGRPEAPAGAADTGSSGPGNSRWLGLLLAALVVLAYQPTWRAGFIWDDSSHVTRADLRSLHGLARIWFEPGATQQYYPVLHSAFWVEHRLWGDAPLGYHLANVGLHLLVTLLLYRVLRRLRVPGALLGAALFSLHPVAVESVAWISEQKNTLSAVFYLAAALAYLRFDLRRGGRWYLAALLLFVLAVLSKSVTATLPAALLVVFWWKRGRLSLRNDVLPLLPFFALGAAAGWTTAWMERTFIGADGAPFSLGLAPRVLIAGRALWFYLGKLLCPSGLTFIYPRWHVDPHVPWQWLFPAAAAAVLGTAWAFRRRTRGPLASALLFAGTLFPALGFINVYPFLYSYVADHFQYLAAAMAISAGAAAFTLLVAHLSGRARVAAHGAAGWILALLVFLTWRQCAVYYDLETLWLTTIARNPDCWMAYNNLAAGSLEKGRVDEAIAEGRRALAIYPRFAEAHNILGTALLQRGRWDDAVGQFNQALEIDPKNFEAQNNLGIAFMHQGRVDDAIARYQLALELEPDNFEAHASLGSAWLRRGRPDRAMEQYRQALEINPDFGEAHFSLANALFQAGRPEEAAVQYREVLRLNPGYARAHDDLANALLKLGRLDDAVAEYRRALEIDPAYAEARHNLGVALLRLGRREEGQAQLRQAAAPP